MGTKYQSVAVSGYNSSPPADDASQSESNKVKWSTIKTKLPDPLKTAIEAVNSALVTALDQSVRSVSAADSTVAGDHNRTIQIASTVTASITISLGDAATMAAGYIVTIANQSNVACVVDRVTASNTINGVTSSVSIASLESITFIVNSSTNGYIIKNRGRARGAITSSDFTMATARLLGRTTASTGAIEEISVGASLTLSGGSLSGTAASDTQAGVIEVATQAEVEADSSTTLAVTPGRQRFHLSAAKFWISFNGTGVISGYASYNVSSTTDNGVGDYTVNSTNNLASTMPIAVAKEVDGDAIEASLANCRRTSATAVRVRTSNGSNAAADCAIVNVLAFGDET